MKKIISFVMVLLLILSSFSLIGCDISVDEDGGEIVSRLTALPAPVNIRVEKDNYVYWDEVPNANSYVVKINNYQESVGNSLKLNIGAIIDARIEYNTPTELHIFIKAKGNQILYADSDWSSECVYTYIKQENDSGLNNKKIKLDTPVFSYDTAMNIITWNAVNGADGYELKINEEEIYLPQTLDCSYEPDVNQERFIFSMKALAAFDDEKYVDSNWSRSITYKFSPIHIVETNMEYVNKARELGIGYAYNFIDDVYFDVTNSSNNSVINLEKLFTMAKLNSQPSNYTKNDSIYSENISDFQLNVATSLNSEVSVGGAFDIFSANVSAGLQSSSSIDFSKYSKSGFLNCYSYSEYKNYQVVDYGTSLELASMLSDNFYNLVNKQGSYSTLSDTAIANYILNSYGTHLILGVKTGGRLDYYYSFATNSYNVAADFKKKVTANGSIGIAGLVAGSTNNSLSAELKLSLEKQKTENNSSFVIYGGSTDGITASNIEEQMISWSSSINEKNARSIGVSKGGMVYLPTLISYINPQIGSTLDALIKHNADSAYKDLVSKFKTNDINFGDSKDYEYIYSSKDFIEKISEDLTGNYVIMNDIDFKGQSLLPFAKFSGTLRGNNVNGKNPVIKNFTISTTDKPYCGLFTELTTEGAILNVDIDSCTVNYKYDDKGAEGAFSALVGLSQGTIENCVVRNSTFTGYLYKNIGTKSSVKLHGGAIAGRLKDGRVNNCKSVNNSFSSRCNGGRTDGTIENNIGGIVGMSVGKSIINNCQSSQTKITITLRGGKTWTFIHAKFNGRAGGIVGYNGSAASIMNCSAKTSDVGNYSFAIQKAESCGYDDHNSKNAIFGKNDGNASGNKEV